MDNTMKKEWDDFELKVVPIVASAEQRKSMKSAFYSGALVAFALLLGAINDDDDEESVANIDRIHKEIEGYFDGLAD